MVSRAAAGTWHLLDDVGDKDTWKLAEGMLPATGAQRASHTDLVADILMDVVVQKHLSPAEDMDVARSEAHGLAVRCILAMCPEKGTLQARYYEARCTHHALVWCDFVVAVSLEWVLGQQVWALLHLLEFPL